MIEVERSVNIDIPPATLWDRIGAYDAIAAWHPGIAAAILSTVDGRTRRTLTLIDDAVLIEDRLDDGSDPYAYEYEIVDGPVPVANYQARFAVFSHGQGSIVTWSGRFDAKGIDETQAKHLVAGIYAAGLTAIADLASKGAR